jgi:uncharacterized protein DUF4154
MAVLNALVRASPKGCRRVVSTFWLIISALLFPALRDVSGQTPDLAAQVKAEYLLRFAQFVKWPPEAFPDAHSPLVIGILGEDPFGRYLDEIARGKRVNNRPFSIQRYRRVGDITTCHVLFISRSENAQIPGFLANRSILLVGESEGFAARGGAIEFVPHGKNIWLKINPGAAQAARLAISSKLLLLSEIVPPRKE